MKRMKKVLILVAALFVGIQAHAQLQADGGYQHFFEQWQYRNGEDRGNHNGPDWDGFYVGGRYNINLPWVDGLSVIPGANFSFMFSKVATDASCREIALNIPIDAAYTLDLGTLQLRGFAGPSIQVGLLNHMVARGGNQTTSYNMYGDNGNNYVLGTRTRVNVSLGIGAGFVVRERFTGHIRYDLGLANLTTAQYWKLFRNTLQVGVGYIF